MKLGVRPGNMLNGELLRGHVVHRMTSTPIPFCAFLHDVTHVIAEGPDLVQAAAQAGLHFGQICVRCFPLEERRNLPSRPARDRK